MRHHSLINLHWKKRFSYVKNSLFEAKDLRQPGTRFQIVKFGPGSKIGPHYHQKACEIFYVRSGNGILKINRKKFLLSPDEIFFIEPGDSHALENNGEEDLILLIFKTNEIPNEDIFWE